MGGLREGRVGVSLVDLKLRMVLVLGMLVIAWAAPARAAPTRLRIKNGRNVMVAVGRSRESASAIRPDKKVWTLELTADLVGGVAELQDVTPNVPSARWTLPVAAERLVLDEVRFLPSHIYRVEVRRERQVLGSALVYLTPPTVARVSHVDLDERPEPETIRAPAADDAPGITPKGGL
jgi:hypothetical protein